MADVQLEHGFTRIANELIEALVKAGLTGGQLGMMLSLVRRTWGYNQTAAKVSCRALARDMAIDHRNAQRTLRELIGMNLIVRLDRGERATPVLSIQKDHDLWQSGVNLDASKKTTSGVTSDTPPGVLIDARAGVPIDATAKTKDKEKDKERELSPPGKPKPKPKRKSRARSKPLTDSDLEAAVLDRCERLRPWMLSETYKSKPQVSSWAWAWVLAEIDQAKLHAKYSTAKDPLGFVWGWICRDDAREISKAQAFGRIEGMPRKEPYLERLALARADAEFVREHFAGPEPEPEPEAQTEVADLWT